MASPTVTARQYPLGIMQRKGFPVLVTFTANPNISFWEMGVQPPGADGGEPVPTSTMFLNLYRTFASRQLITITPIEIEAGYATKLYEHIMALINVEGSCNVHLSDNSTIAFYGYLQKFQPDSQEEGKDPKCKITIAVTNWDPVNNVEQGPVFAPGTGT